ncbi:GNAT family N-acetyltransferase [Candidatus Falkowbacteria bacterium]|nr:GNAT family N-acetyltransferase [Candidatus Falkowbacteria bacterium]
MKLSSLSEKKLDKLFNPQTIAVIGASDKEGGVGNALMKNLISNNFKGIVYPVNPKREAVQGIKTYPSVSDIPDKIDLAIIATPAKTVPALVEECGRAGVSGIVVISAGFDEIGEEGKKMSEQIYDTAKAYRMRILGPNCLGFIRPSLNLNASFANKMALKGKIALISQSGALCASILDWAVKNNVGFSHFVSIGSAIDVSYHDLIDYLGDDPDTESILVYMESLKDARKFMSAARAFARQKPIIILKVGRTSEGAQAAKSHTGSLAGNDAVYDAAFERAGAIRVDTALDLFHVAKTLAMQGRPQGNRLAVVTNAGGPGVIATDYLVYKEGVLAELDKKTINKLDKKLPKAWSRSNPIDVLGDADADRYKIAVGACIDDENVDAVLTILTPQAMTDPEGVAKEIVALNKKAAKSQKMMFASWMGGDDVLPARKILEKGNVPIYRTPEEAVKNFMYLNHYTKNLESLNETPATIPHAFKPKNDKARKLIDNLAAEERSSMTEDEAKKLLSYYDISVPKYEVANSAKEAGRLAAKIGFPAVMKIVSPDILHKTDVGGVAVGIKSSSEAEKAYKQIIRSAKKKVAGADIRGVLIEQMAKKRYELLIGCKKDKVFGPAIVFGMGGVAVEVFKDTKVGLPPLNMSLALKMIESTKIYKLLKGYRNMPDVDIASIQFLLYKFAYLISDFPEIKELDINPFSVDEKGGVVLDAKVVLDEEVLGIKTKPYSHLVISPYPKEYITKYTLKNKKQVEIRPIKPEDEPLEAEMFTKFSKETQRQRFFHTIKEITHEMLQRYTQIDYDREIALIALVNEGKKKQMAGVVRLIADPYNETAEFSIVVADPWQGLGLGNKLTDYLLDIAEKRGIKRVWATFLADNEKIKTIFKKRGFRVFGKGKTLKAELNLQD